MKVVEKKYVNVEKIKKYIKDSHISQLAFAKKCGMSVGTLWKIFSGNKNYKLAQLLDISHTMNVPIGEILNKDELKIVEN